MARGIFIVIDGIDGSGKATQARRLAERFTEEERKVEKIDFPRYGQAVFGELLGECLAGKRGDFLHLDPKIASTLYALDRYEASEQIRSWLEEGTVVIADRFASSNQIHQGGKILQLDKRETFLSWLEHLEHNVLRIPRPDAVVYLRMTVEVSLELLSQERAVKNKHVETGGKDVVEKDRMYLERSLESANHLAGLYDGWHVIDCVKDNQLRSREDIHEEVYRITSTLTNV
jgi:dTMP kinase